MVYDQQSKSSSWTPTPRKSSFFPPSHIQTKTETKKGSELVGNLPSKAQRDKIRRSLFGDIPEMTGAKAETAPTEAKEVENPTQVSEEAASGEIQAKAETGLSQSQGYGVPSREVRNKIRRRMFGNLEPTPVQKQEEEGTSPPTSILQGEGSQVEAGGEEKGLAETEISLPIQAKLTIGEPNDKYEQEADRVARQVVDKIHSPTPETVQREEMGDEDAVRLKSDAGSGGKVEAGVGVTGVRKSPIAGVRVNRKVNSEGETQEASAELEASIQGKRGSGQPLDESVKEPMEREFGADFSGVRVHTDAKSDELNQAIQAKAFTTGEDIFFREGAYEPGSQGGQELLAHELTHVVQQKGEAVQKEEEIVVNATTNKKIQPTRITVEDKEIPGTKNEDMGEFQAHLINKQNDWNYLAQIKNQLTNLEKQTEFDIQALKEVNKYMQQLQHEKPKDDERKISLTEMKTMADLLNTFEVKIDQYKVPDINIKKNKKENQKKIEAFNNMLEKLFNKELYTQSFSVTINVGNLDGLGDITAAIKLALELKQFFKQIEQWEEVKVSLHFHKLHQEGNKLEKERAKKLINNMLSGTTINWNNGETQEEEEEKENEKQKPKKVEFSYPAHNAPGKFNVSQYGYNQLNSERRQLGSGPGYGSLGVLPVSEEEKNEAIEAIDSIENKNSNHPILEKIKNIMHKYKINALHFGYFSKYENAVKQYVQQVDKYHEQEKDKVIGIAISKSAINLNRIAESLGQKKKRVKVLTINEYGEESENEQSKNDSNNKNDKKSSNNKTNRKKSNRQKSRKNQRPVNEKETPIEEEKIDYVLINLCNGVPHRTMLSLYYMSDAPVGATGDQSFMEAYGMRRKKNKATEADEKEKGQEEKENNKATTDILYDVPEQQKGLKRQLEEIKNNELTLGNEAQKGLTPIVVTEKVENEINKKHLLYTIIMLINESLQSE